MITLRCVLNMWFAARHLPEYARPAFVRVVPEMDVTGTLQQRKQVLAADGFDPARIADPLVVFNPAVSMVSLIVIGLP